MRVFNWLTEYAFVMILVCVWFSFVYFWKFTTTSKRTNLLWISDTCCFWCVTADFICWFNKRQKQPIHCAQVSTIHKKCNFSETTIESSNLHSLKMIRNNCKRTGCVTGTRYGMWWSGAEPGHSQLNLATIINHWITAKRQSIILHKQKYNTKSYQQQQNLDSTEFSCASGFSKHVHKLHWNQ